MMVLFSSPFDHDVWTTALDLAAYQKCRRLLVYAWNSMCIGQTFDYYMVRSFGS